MGCLVYEFIKFESLKVSRICGFFGGMFMGVLVRVDVYYKSN